MMTTTEVAEALGVCVRTLLRWDKAGVLRPTYRLPGGAWRYSREDVDAFLARAGNQQQVEA